METKRTSRKVKITGFFLILLILWGCGRALEYGSLQILIKNNLLSANGLVNGRAESGNRLSLWSGGTDNMEYYSFTGYNDSLVPGERTYTDQYGFDHGDSLPLPRTKGPGTVRIVLTGGSGMKGTLQIWSVIKMHGYPQGVYDYHTSIAGKLKHILTARYPDVRWEVINAAVVGHQFNQGLARYYEKIHDIHPDIIINMDGYNDDELATDFLTEGDPYPHTAGQATRAIELEMLRRSSRWGYTCMLLCYGLTQGEMKETNGLDIHRAINKTTLRDVWHIAQEMNRPADSMRSMTADSFRYIIPYMLRNIQKELWLVASYEQQLRHDSVYSIYCYQPMLAREAAQKKLSAKELAMKNYINADEPDYLMPDDSLFLHDAIGAAPDLIHASRQMGIARHYIRRYYHRYFINDYLSPMTDSIVRSYGGAYVDLGVAMETLGDTSEFYLDYTHTTPLGNQFIAQQMAAQVAGCPRLAQMMK